MHSLLIGLHAGTGLIALIAGGIALYRGRFFDVYLASLVATTVFLALAVAVEWTLLGAGSRVLFTAFTLLAGVMVARGVLARRLPPRSPAHLEHLGFTLVGLFDAFVVIAVLNAGAPIWLVVTSGVLIAVGGHVALQATKRALAGEPVPV
ncbi:hypothetical protein [Actinophytocola sp. NPDC049390]|uniref:hypothetical protein n=1 Tax=Actinophytocola sp. NPDC049390 TaxID=3363894 RepID=UPI0037AD960D